MEVDEAIAKLEVYPAFIEWKKINHESYLTHGFAMIEDALKDNNINSWQIGYYNEKKDRITAFDVGEKIIQSGEEEVFKKDGTINKLEVKKVKLKLSEALQKIDEIKEKKYKTEIVSKKIIVLQNIHEGTVWNITYITMRFNIINIKIDAHDGKLLFESIENLMQWKK
jgi:hypothetical protein